MLGLPRLFKDVDITAEYPLDIDDGYINEQNFLSIFSSDSSIGSSAVALFRCSRVLARVLDIMYPTAVAHDGSLRRLEELQTELEGWRAELAPHLWLEFVNGVPGTKLVHCQPLLLVCSNLPVMFCSFSSSFLFLFIVFLKPSFHSVSQFTSHMRVLRYLLQYASCLQLVNRHLLIIILVF